MEVQLTERAKDKGLMKMELFSKKELAGCIAGVIYEKRTKDGEIIEWLDPILIFKSGVKHGDYDKAFRLAEKAGILLLLPEAKNFKTDYYGLSFDGHKNLIKSWGYTSNHLPPNKRWNENKMREAANTWLEDTVLLAEIVLFILDKLSAHLKEEEIVEMVRTEFSQKQLVG